MDKVGAIIEGLQIFKKYGKVDTAAEHDEIYAGPAGGVGNKEDLKRLAQLGWHYNRSLDTWTIFT